MGDPAINPRRRKAAVALASGKAKDTRQALIQAGYAPTTADNPKRNGLSGERLIREGEAIIQAQGDSLKALSQRSRAYIAKTLEDPKASASIRAPLAVQVLRLAQEYAVEEGEAIPPHAWRWLGDLILKGYHAGWEAAVRRGVAQVQVKAIIEEP